MKGTPTPGTPPSVFPFFGALPDPDGVRFRVWAPAVQRLTLVLHGGPAGEHPMPAMGDGLFELTVPGAQAGQRYSYRLDGAEEIRPDPASRFQPRGVHGPSEVIDPHGFAWHDAGWEGLSPRELVLYELHVGAFTPAGSFDAASERLSYLRDLGVTAVELMPLADFPGHRNWGYDGVALFAPSRAYGRPDDLRRFVDRAHGLGLGVFVDAVYNHLGPEGGYQMLFNPGYLTDRHVTPWGRAVNLDGPDAAMVRRFIIDNALHWIREYHVDGLRLDATHALIDESPRHLLHELTSTVREQAGRPVLIHAEDHRNFAAMVQDDLSGGWGLDAVWADDFHHVIRRMVAGDTHGYYSDFEGTADELARTLRQGWLYTGQLSRHRNKPRGSDPSRVAMQRFVVCLQNHDQIGNRAFGDRLSQVVDAATWRAVTTALLTCPMTPLLFMGQEWAASTPFCYFTDLEPGLGALVTAGRRLEFAEFPDFTTPEAVARIPDPQSPETFERSRLRWSELASPPHAASLALYTTLLALRRRHEALTASPDTTCDATAVGTAGLVMRRQAAGEEVWVMATLKGDGILTASTAQGRVATDVEVLFSTEDARFAADPVSIPISLTAAGLTVRFDRPGAVVLRAVAPVGSGA